VCQIGAADASDNGGGLIIAEAEIARTNPA
jgi:hypothetical protein